MGIPRLLPYLISTLILATTSLLPGEDQVRFKDGTRLSGVVVELGGNRVELRTAGSSRKILKRDIDRIDFDEARPSSAVQETDGVVKKSGHLVRGTVEMLDGGQKVQVTLAGGARVTFPRQDIEKIIRKGDVLGEDPTVYTVELGKAMSSALEKLRQGADKDVEAFLVRCGSLGIARVKEFLGKQPQDSPGRESLQRIIRIHEIKEVVATEIESSEPKVYEILGYGSTQEKCSLLLFVFPRFVEESVSLAEYLAQDPTEDETVRAWAVDFLRRMQKNRELVKIYKRATGQVQLATAIALGHNRVLIGLPAIIDALELDSEEIRALALKSLRELASSDFGFVVDGAPQARREAITRARSWWQQNEPGIVQAAEGILHANLEGAQAGAGVRSLERIEAMKLWSQAGLAVDAKQYSEAEALLRRALNRDSSFFQGHLALAVVLYTFTGKSSEAIRLLDDLKTKRLPGVSAEDRQWIFLHLGNARSLDKDYARATEAYESARRIAPDNLYALVGLLDTAFQEATRESKLTGEERKAKLRLALESGRRALEVIEKTNESLVALNLESLALGGELPFDRRDYNRSVLDLRKSYRQESKEIAYKIAKLLALLGEKKEAVLALRNAMDGKNLESTDEARKLEANIRCYLGVLYEELNQPVAALREYRRIVEELDARHVEAQHGIERLRRSKSDRASN